MTTPNVVGSWGRSKQFRGYGTDQHHQIYQRIYVNLNKSVAIYNEKYFDQVIQNHCTKVLVPSSTRSKAKIQSQINKRLVLGHSRIRVMAKSHTFGLFDPFSYTPPDNLPPFYSHNRMLSLDMLMIFISLCVALLISFGEGRTKTHQCPGWHF